MTVANELPAGKRVVAGWLSTSLISILFFKGPGILAFPVAYLIGVLVLRYCYGRKWLQWWHALAAGWLTGLMVAIVYLGSIDSWSAKTHGPKAFVGFQSFGVAVALSFWAIAVFRNPRFPQKPTNVPLLVLCTGTLAALAVALMNRFEVQEVFGRVAETPEGARVTLFLGNGAGAKAWFRESDLQLPETREVGAYTRWAALSEERLYWINGMWKDPLDGRIVPCVFDDRYMPPAPQGTRQGRP